MCHYAGLTRSRRLREAGVSLGQMHGRVTPTRRATCSRQFKNFEFPVILGSEACAEGHDWPQARNALLLAYSWSPDKIKQFLDRIWRINSTQDVNVYLITPQPSRELPSARYLRLRRASFH